jgi:uncharacterized membrane protein
MAEIQSTSDPTPEKQTSRLEAFSDGVLAVIITIMAFELKAPIGSDFGSLRHRIPALLVYVLSFTFVGIYWNNHHHLLRATERLSGAVMWANLVLLFWLSLIPVSTEWVGDDYNHTAPAATYAFVALGAAVAYTLLVVAIMRSEGRSSRVTSALGNDLKGRLSMCIYAVGVGVSFVSPWLTYGLLALVALIWFIPDRRLERG